MGSFAKRNRGSLTLGLVFLIALVVAHFAQPDAARGYDPVLGPQAQTKVDSGDAAPEPAPVEPATRTRTSKTYEEFEVQGGGSIRGTVRFTATPPIRIIEFNKDQKSCGHDSQPTQRMQYDPQTLGVANCVLFLADITRGKPWTGEMAKDEDTREAVLDQKGCTYVPHVLPMRLDTQVVVRNSDPAEHNVHFTGGGNILSPSGSVQRPGPAFQDKVGIHEVKCDIHGWMNGYAFVSRHPYYAVTAKDGEFEIANVPPGEYTLVLWHEGMQEIPQFGAGGITGYDYGKDVRQEQKIRVAGGKTVELELTLTPPAK